MRRWVWLFALVGVWVFFGMGSRVRLSRCLPDSVICRCCTFTGIIAAVLCVPCRKFFWMFFIPNFFPARLIGFSNGEQCASTNGFWRASPEATIPRVMRVFFVELVFVL